VSARWNERGGVEQPAESAPTLRLAAVRAKKYQKRENIAIIIITINIIVVIIDVIIT